jgi:hypothetical protein
LAGFQVIMYGRFWVITEEIYGYYGRRDGRGKAAYHPVMMVRVTVDADVRQMAARSKDALANVERRGESDGFNSHVDAFTVSEFHHPLDGISIRTID